MPHCRPGRYDGSRDDTSPQRNQHRPQGRERRKGEGMAVESFPIEFSHIMMFARSVGDDNPIYHDPKHAKTTEPGSVIAPPPFAQASAQFDPTYGLRPQPGKPWFGSGGEPTGVKRAPGGGGEGGGNGGG